VSLPVKIKCEKNRWGARGEFPAVFEKANGQSFRELEPPKKHRGMPDSRPDDREDVF
jgi:hypothetical protein